MKREKTLAGLQRGQAGTIAKAHMSDTGIASSRSVTVRQLRLREAAHLAPCASSARYLTSSSLFISSGIIRGQESLFAPLVTTSIQKNIPDPFLFSFL